MDKVDVVGKSSQRFKRFPAQESVDPTLTRNIYSRLSRCSTARGPGIGFSLVCPTKVKACKSFQFTENSLK